MSFGFGFYPTRLGRIRTNIHGYGYFCHLWFVFLEDFNRHQERDEIEQINGVRKKWQKSAEGFVSITTDAAILEGGGAGLGVVARDSKGDFILAAVKRVRGIWEAEQVEALAMELGIQTATLIQAPRLVLESDCQTLVLRLQNSMEDVTDMGIICGSIQRGIRNMGEVRVTHIGREANVAAHLMAQVNARWDERQVWFDTPPLMLLNQLLLDNVIDSLN
ncbi:unnamed protein product [Linum trigynum]|uniref:RNase H type-1 domain-containing protein n=1 Tax=Linum trigynum TaxID=586398 RepID=A0AAV2C7D0_9ROSI